MQGSLIAIDWGTTNRRVLVLDADGVVQQVSREDRGVLAIPLGGFADEVRDIRSRFGELPILAVGMVGSTRGWYEVPYVPAPATLATIAQGLYWIEPGCTAIVPGVAWRDGSSGDVMRGEEVQLLGAVAAGLVPRDAVLCQPGTHCKWATMVDGRIDQFTTSMTGELFALLKGHSILSGQMGGLVAPGAAFGEGVADAQRGDLLSRLFSIRASSLLGLRADADAPSYVSGLLIGSDVVARRLDPDATVYVIADATLGALYAAAVAQLGGTAHVVESEAAFVAGVRAIWEQL